jgi:hypothetical protein
MTVTNKKHQSKKDRNKKKQTKKTELIDSKEVAVQASDEILYSQINSEFAVKLNKSSSMRNMAEKPTRSDKKSSSFAKMRKTFSEARDDSSTPSTDESSK